MQINVTCNGRKSTSNKLWKKNNEDSEYNKSRSNLWGNKDLEFYSETYSLFSVDILLIPLYNFNSETFAVGRGTRQGSIISPYLLYLLTNYFLT